MGLCDVQATEADIVPGDQMDIFPYAFVDEAGSPVPAEAVGCFAHIRICGNALLRDGLHLHDGGEFDVHRLYLRQQGSDGRMEHDAQLVRTGMEQRLRVGSPGAEHVVRLEEWLTVYGHLA